MTYQLPHPLDREHQLEVMDWILNNDKKYLILCAPTGFGKSPLPAAHSLTHKTLVLVLHKSLQSANYKEQYNFDILYGKSNYPCLERNKKQGSFLSLPQFTAYDCGNPECNCPYQQQELHCVQSQRVSLNYAKFLMSKQFTEIMQPDILYCDEAHNLPDIVMDFVGLSLDWNNEFAQCNGGIKPLFEGRLNYNEAMNLFRQYARVVHSNKPEQKEDLSKWRKWKRLNQRINTVNEIISNGNLEDWYYETDHKSLIIKPLTAKYHFKRLFDVAGKVIMMSATITPRIAERLGIEPDEFDFMEVPNIWPVPTRLVHDLGGPAINWKSSEEDKEEQARLIASILRPDKTGVIHIMSKNEKYLRDFLGKLRGALLQRSYKFPEAENIGFYIPSDNVGTDNQLKEWCKVRWQIGTYCISWNFQEGVDLGQDDINILAKVPYASIGSNYERARMEYDQQWYLTRTAYKFIQALGRNRRGIKEHYLPDARQVYIADSAWHRLKSHLPTDFLRSIRNYNGNR